MQGSENKTHLSMAKNIFLVHYKTTVIAGTTNTAQKFFKNGNNYFFRLMIPLPPG
jgi:hypothetical protein